jgi:hypothetical protein
VREKEEKNQMIWNFPAVDFFLLVYIQAMIIDVCFFSVIIIMKIAAAIIM